MITSNLKIFIHYDTFQIGWQKETYFDEWWSECELREILTTNDLDKVHGKDRLDHFRRMFNKLLIYKVLKEGE